VAVDDDGMHMKERDYGSTGSGFSDNYAMSRGPSSTYGGDYSTTSLRMSRVPRITYGVESVSSNSPYQYSQESIYEPAMPRSYRAPSSPRHLLAYNRYS
jgi:hypothetical protein